MPVITNNYPYYDDYDPFDGYHRILFKPGVAVQARELTQLQTILQNQSNKLGDRVVDDGVVLDGVVVVNNSFLDLFIYLNSLILYIYIYKFIVNMSIN